MTWFTVALIAVVMCTQVRHVGVSVGVIVASALLAALSLLGYHLPVTQPWEIAELGSATVGLILALLIMVRTIDLLFRKPRSIGRRGLFRIATITLLLLLPFQMEASWGVGFFSL